MYKDLLERLAEAPGKVRITLVPGVCKPYLRTGQACALREPEQGETQETGGSPLLLDSISTGTALCLPCEAGCSGPIEVLHPPLLPVIPMGTGNPSIDQDWPTFQPRPDSNPYAGIVGMLDSVLIDFDVRAFRCERDFESRAPGGSGPPAAATRHIAPLPLQGHDDLERFSPDLEAERFWRIDVEIWPDAGQRRRLREYLRLHRCLAGCPGVFERAIERVLGLEVHLEEDPLHPGHEHQPEPSRLGGDWNSLQRGFRVGAPIPTEAWRMRLCFERVPIEQYEQVAADVGFYRRVQDVAERLLPIHIDLGGSPGAMLDRARWSLQDGDARSHLATPGETGRSHLGVNFHLASPPEER